MPEPRTLKREISLTAATAIVVGSVIGSGIFRSPSLVAQQFPDPWVILGLWIVGGLVTVAGALAVAELATMYPRSGGPYVFVKEAFGDSAGFLAGWLYFVLGKLAIGAAVAIVFAEHASFLGERWLGFPLSQAGILLLAAWAVTALTFVNWMGVRLGANVNTFLTALKALSLAAVVGLAFFFTPGEAGAATVPVVGGANVAVAVLAVLFAYNSWINATIVGEEVVDPARNLPRALAFGTLLTMVLYVGVNASYLWVLGADGMAANPLVGTAAAQRVFEAGGLFVAGAVLVSTFGNLNGGILTGARLPFSMARDGFLPPVFATISRRGVPAAGLLLELVPTLVLLFALGTFASLISAATFASWLILAAICAGLYRLRVTRPDAERPYRVWGYPWLPGIFLLAATFVVGVTALQQPAAVVVTAVWAAIGVALLFVARALWRPRAQAEKPVAEPVPVEAP